MTPIDVAELDKLHAEAMALNIAINDMIGERHWISICDFPPHQEVLRLASMGFRYQACEWFYWAKGTAIRMWENGAVEQIDM